MISAMWYDFLIVLTLDCVDDEKLRLHGQYYGCDHYKFLPMVASQSIVGFSCCDVS